MFKWFCKHTWVVVWNGQQSYKGTVTHSIMVLICAKCGESKLDKNKVEEKDSGEKVIKEG